MGIHRSAVECGIQFADLAADDTEHHPPSFFYARLYGCLHGTPHRRDPLGGLDGVARSSGFCSEEVRFSV